jgi:uncharacterized membrane protein YedE/YeeE
MMGSSCDVAGAAAAELAADTGPVVALMAVARVLAGAVVAGGAVALVGLVAWPARRLAVREPLCCSLPM